MSIQEKYNIEESVNSFSICPKKPSLAMSWWFLAGIIGGSIMLLFFKFLLDEVMQWVIFIFMIYFALHMIYDIKIGSKIKYTFNADENAVYKTSPLRSKRKILKLSESVVFVHSEMGSWYYALGAQKSQFVKNYIISESFGSGKKNEAKAIAYDDFVLKKIDGLIDLVS